MIRKITIALILVFFAMVAVIDIIGIRYNPTNSIPSGFYIVTNGEINKNDYVEFTPEKNEIFNKSKLLNIYEKKMLKKVYAMHNDIVTISNECVTINGKSIQNTKPISKIFTPFYMHEYKLKEDEFLLLSEMPKSFDSRYFGSVRRTSIKYCKQIFSF